MPLQFNRTLTYDLTDTFLQARQQLYPMPRHRFDEPLTLREPLAGADNDDPVQRAALGARGTLYGRDYRNERVLAMVSTVPDSPWLLISKMDVADAFTDAQRREWLAETFRIRLLQHRL